MNCLKQSSITTCYILTIKIKRIFKCFVRYTKEHRNSQLLMSSFCEIRVESLNWMHALKWYRKIEKGFGKINPIHWKKKKNKDNWTQGKTQSSFLYFHMRKSTLPTVCPDWEIYILIKHHFLCSVFPQTLLQCYDFWCSVRQRKRHLVYSGLEATCVPLALEWWIFTHDAAFKEHTYSKTYLCH